MKPDEAGLLCCSAGLTQHYLRSQSHHPKDDMLCRKGVEAIYQVLCHEIKRGLSQAAHKHIVRQALCAAQLV